MYEDDQGRFKGEALIVYFRPESVQLAVQMLDDTSLRFGEAEKMKVQPADYSYKSQQEAPSIAGGFAAVKSAHKGERRQVIKKTQKLNECVQLPASSSLLSFASPSQRTLFFSQLS